jgi:hypothetical protein
MSHIITELKNLSLGEVTNNDYIIVTEVTNSLGEIQTKTMNLGEYTKYNITSSNVLKLFRSGSHSGTFVGNLLGSALSSSVSTTASISNTTNYLNYSANNGTASYSINANNVPINSNSSYALTSSYSINSITSSIASHVNVDVVTYKATTSDFSDSSITASNSQKTNYLNFDGTDNGIVYHAINSDTCSYASIATGLSYPNTSTANRSITSSYSFTSISSSYSLSSSYTDFSIKSIFSESEAHAYITLLINGTVKQLEDAIQSGNISGIVSVKEYYNINKAIISPGINNSIDIIIQFENELKDEKSALIKVDSSSRVQFDDTAYMNDTDLFDYLPSLNASDAVDNIPWDITTGKSCSKSTAKITLIGRKYGSKMDESYAEQFEVPATTVFNKSYISLIVLSGNVIGEGKNYPETPPTTIPPKC